VLLSALAPSSTILPDGDTNFTLLMPANIVAILECQTIR
jgi:hypothetical protein